VDAYADRQRSIVDAFPDYRWELRHLIVEAPWIAAHLTDAGTHRGAIYGVPATGRSVTIQPSTGSTRAALPRCAAWISTAAPRTAPVARVEIRLRMGKRWGAGQGPGLAGDADRRRVRAAADGQQPTADDADRDVAHPIGP
jgi:hypothetical protein